MKTVAAIENLYKTYRTKRGTYTAVDKISFSFHEGEILGLLGPNGAGKTTTANMLIGALTPTSGNISYFGKPFLGAEDPALQHINFASAYSSIPGRLTVRENLKVFSLLYGIKNYSDRVTRLLKDFDMEELSNRRVNGLSAGQKTRVLLMKAMVNYPRIMLLDEPTASLDPDVSQKVRHYLVRQRNEYGVSILFTSHNMAEVEEICDRVIFLSKGKIVAEDTPRGITKKIKKSGISFSLLSSPDEFNAYCHLHKLQSERTNGKVTITLSESDIPPLLFKLQKKGIEMTDIEILRPTLEDFFLEVAGKHIDETITEGDSCELPTD